MNKQDLIGKVSGATGLARSEAGLAVQAVFDAIIDALRHGDEARVVGFGNFTVTTRKASNGRNPRTGEPMAIAASSIPKFKAGKDFRDAVN
jgi:DNA-binding protein HU-beta